SRRTAAASPTGPDAAAGLEVSGMDTPGDRADTRTGLGYREVLAGPPEGDLVVIPGGCRVLGLAAWVDADRGDAGRRGQGGDHAPAWAGGTGQVAVGGVRGERVAAGGAGAIAQAVGAGQGRELTGVQRAPGPLARVGAQRGGQV